MTGVGKCDVETTTGEKKEALSIFPTWTSIESVDRTPSDLPNHHLSVPLLSPHSTKPPPYRAPSPYHLPEAAWPFLKPIKMLRYEYSHRSSKLCQYSSIQQCYSKHRCLFCPFCPCVPYFFFVMVVAPASWWRSRRLSQGAAEEGSRGRVARARAAGSRG